jgi:small-conductance mechanosensitive channel
MTLDELLATTFWGVTLSDFLLALGSAVVLTFVLRVVFAWLLRRTRSLATRTATDLDDLVVELLDKTKTLLIGVIALWLATRPLSLDPDVESVIRAVLVIGLLLQAGYWGMGVVNYFLLRWRKQQLDEDDAGIATAVGVVGFLARVGLWAILLLTALGTLGINIGPFVASLGIGGVAVALALQNVLGDLFGSLSIILDKPFVIGDFIVVGSEMGTVEHVGLKTTRIRSISGEQLVLSNSDILSSRIRNFGRMEERRIVFTVGVEYGTPPEQLKSIPDLVKAAVESRSNARFDRCHFKGFGDSSLDFETVYYMTVPDYAAYMDTQQDINLELYERFGSAGIGFAFPTRTLHVFSENGGGGGEGGDGNAEGKGGGEDGRARGGGEATTEGSGVGGVDQEGSAS